MASQAKDRFNFEDPKDKDTGNLFAVTVPWDDGDVDVAGIDAAEE